MKKIFLAMFLLAAAARADELVIAAGSSSHTYEQMLKQLSSVCNVESGVQLTFANTSGAIENLDKLTNKDADGALLHSDVIVFRDQTEKLFNIKTLVPLYPEDVHFVAKSAPFKKGTFKGSVALDSVTDLNGLKVGAAGGGFITANLINNKGAVGYEVVKFESGDDVLNAVKSGDVAAGIFVGGAPLLNLSGLGPDFKLLGVGDTLADRLKGPYSQTQITYTKMSPVPVRTVAPQALLVVRQVKLPKFQDNLRRLRSCFYDHLTELQETRGMHKKWQLVPSREEAEDNTKWPLYDLGNAAPATKAQPAEATRPVKRMH